MKKILLTGSTGFVGSAILAELSKKHSIYCLNRKKIKQSNKFKNIYFKNFCYMLGELKKPLLYKNIAIPIIGPIPKMKRTNFAEFFV